MMDLHTQKKIADKYYWQGRHDERELHKDEYARGMTHAVFAVLLVVVVTALWKIVL